MLHPKWAPQPAESHFWPTNNPLESGEISAVVRQNSVSSATTPLDRGLESATGRKVYVCVNEVLTCFSNYSRIGSCGTRVALWVVLIIWHIGLPGSPIRWEILDSRRWLLYLIRRVSPSGEL